MPQLRQRLVAEWLGTAFLLAAVVGSGIMAQNLASGNVALALLCNTIPTGAILVVLILIFGPLSGAHFNPAVTLAFGWRGHGHARALRGVGDRLLYALCTALQRQTPYDPNYKKLQMAAQG